MRRLILLLTLAPAAAAFQQGILARDDLPFARKLLDAGYEDLAERVGTAIVEVAARGGTYDANEVLEAKVLVFESEVAGAQREPDLRARSTQLAEALPRATALAAGQPPGPWRDHLDEAVARTQQKIGETLLELLRRKDNDAATVAALHKQADEVFADADEGFARSIDECREQLAQEGADTASLERKIIVQSYSRARMQYLHSLLVADDEYQKLKLVRAALEAFRDFGLDWGDQLLSYEGQIYQGLCRKELGEPDKALEAFDDAIALRETYERGADGRYRIPDDAADIVSSAVLQKVIFLQSTGENAAAVAAAEDYLATIPAPLAKAQGLAVLAAEADAHAAAGNAEEAGRIAQTLIENDPEGPWGARGRELLSHGGGGDQFSASGMQVRLRVVETLLTKGENARVHVECRKLRDASRGTPQEADVGAESLLLDGVAYAREGRLSEACIAYEAAADLYPAGQKAPDALWRSISGFFQLYSEERHPLYKRRAKEHMEQFVKAYPKHENAVLVQLMEGQELEADHDFAAAASAYARVLPSSPVYGEAQLKAGTCLYRQAAALEEDRKSDEAAAARAAARPLLEKAREMLDRQLAQTLEAGARARLADLAFTARATSASLLLQEGGARVAEVLPILADVESTFAGDEDKISTAWSLRIRALELEGKLDEAVEMLDALASKSPDARTLGPAAGSLARALDRASIELHDQDPASPRGQQLARQAARLYGLSVRGQLAGRESPDVRTLEAVGTRLLTLAMSFEGAPEEASSFLDWRPAVQSAPEVWDQAIRVFQALVSAGATYRAEIMLGRIQGLLGNWTEASTTYLRLFEREHLVDPSGRRFDATLIRSEPELVEAWVEWCMAEVEVGRSQQDNSHFTRAADLIDKALANLEKDSRLWWNAKCLQIETLLLRGQYEGADIAMRDVERTTHDFDQGKYGAKPRLLDLKAQIQKKVGGR